MTETITWYYFLMCQLVDYSWIYIMHVFGSIMEKIKEFDVFWCHKCGMAPNIAGKSCSVGLPIFGIFSFNF